MFKLTALSNPAGPAILALSGHMNAEALAELRQRIEAGQGLGGRVVVDLSEVTLMDRAAVRFLAGQPAGGVELVNCPPYIERWISRERAPLCALTGKSVHET